MFNRPRIIPVLLIDDRDLVKTVNFKSPVYLGDPVNAVKIFNIKKVDELAILDISASKRGFGPDFEMLEDIAAQAFMPLSYGGGIKNAEQARKLLAIGYEKLIINTELVKNPNLICEIVNFAGSQSVTASIDAKLVNGEYKCVISDGQETVDITPYELAKKAEKLGVGEILINSVDRDGTMNGYDLKLINDVSSAVSVPIIACGGAGGIPDLKKALDSGAHAAAGGSMFVFYGRLKAVLITAPSEKELIEASIYSE